jgi:uncharacterized phage protein (TIGR01671 family)
MNRDLKFRAWTGEVMVSLPLAGLQYFDFEGSYVLSFAVDAYTGFWGHECYESASKQAGEYPLMQYTGLKDKNGKEIYEGDIIQYKKEGSSRRWDHDRFATSNKIGKATVKYDNGSFFIDGPVFIRLHQLLYYVDHGSHMHGEWVDKYSDFEVVGNIYENPELFQNEKEEQ